MVDGIVGERSEAAFLFSQLLLMIRDAIESGDSDSKQKAVETIDSAVEFAFLNTRGYDDALMIFEQAVRQGKKAMRVRQEE